ncbi:MAG: RluA family pseudouridine synthase [Bacteroidetes bacterium]|nr:RluA family pseudouridine synthase [Bacteroidota bacterium]MBS1629680.1 RluA family pseudouridine synthase [Bacteroidota bacterium]
MKLERLYEDEDYIIVNKPARLLSIPDRFDAALPSARSLLQEEQKQPVFVVHRLDRETSGVLAFAKHEEAHRHLSGLFERHEVGKYYAGLVLGTPAPESGRIEAPIAPHPSIQGKMCVHPRGKPSVTDYKVVESWPLFSLMQWQIHTGRTHQVRVHMSSIGHPIVCDALYGDGKPFLLSTIKKKFKLGKNEEEERPLLSRLALHAYRIRFRNAAGVEIQAEAPLPKDLAACLTQLGKHATHRH